MRDDLTRRERQILEIIYSLEEATANQIREKLPGQPANATVRTLLRVLESKGLVKHRNQGKQFVYQPCIARKSAASSAFKKVLDVFFGGSVEKALAAHLSNPKTSLTPDQIERLRSLIDQQDEKEN